uniref:Peptidase C-terminal archaeal/bacterial domain-containing protein n=1 Tax=Chromera velia CCMP2878 TaxID=1169474 RepID=A0A0G4GE55_9ALVE|eukprot:Cvel_21458.t1-p1 / transcript=Cvel_21458.t1 / gene=Cvel_21458 / organism=Chromera_velia_CCMP2878 / gene_product=hypothetical protein / transcript_product=hypothetical protein / location=Cvel_scaffold2014:17634-20264(+) / protein_length=538 / sequence_SO=supercontig / SO=protein_coding / is_pseudo=false
MHRIIAIRSIIAGTIDYFCSPDNSCPPPTSCEDCRNGGFSCPGFRRVRSEDSSITCSVDDCCYCYSFAQTETRDSSEIVEPRNTDTGYILRCKFDFPSAVSITFGGSPSESQQRKMCTALVNLMQTVDTDFRTAEPVGTDMNMCIQQKTNVKGYSFELECTGDGALQIPSSFFNGTDSEGEPLSPSDSIPLDAVKCGIRIDLEDSEEQDPNDTPEQAQVVPAPDTPIPWRSKFTIRTSTADPRPSFDWYRFTLASPTSLTVETFDTVISNSFPLPDTYLTLYDEQLTQLADNDNKNFFTVTSIIVVDVPAGTYFVRVSAWPGVEWFANMGYTLEITAREYEPPTQSRRLQDAQSFEDPLAAKEEEEEEKPQEGIELQEVKYTYPPQTSAFVEESPGRKDSIATAQHVDISDESKCVMVKGTLEETQHTDCYTFDSVKAGKLLSIRADVTMSPHPLILVSDMDGNPCDTREERKGCCGKSNCRQRGMCQIRTVPEAMKYIEKTWCSFDFLKPGKYSACLRRLGGPETANPYVLSWVNEN